MFFEEEDTKERWKEYITELYGNPDRGSQPFNFEEPLTGPTIFKANSSMQFWAWRTVKQSGLIKFKLK